MSPKPKSAIVFDPRGVVAVDPVPRAPRVAELTGLRLGVLSNRKWNGNKLLRATVAALQDDAEFAAVNFYEKESFSKNVAPKLLATIAADNDIILTAIGD